MLRKGAMAIFATLGQILMTFACGKDRAPAVGAASYSSVVLSVLYGYVFWNEVPHLLVWIGGVLVVLGGVVLLRATHSIVEPAGV